MSDRVRTVIILVVTAVWALNFLVPLANKNYQPNPELNVAFMGTVGALVATYRGRGGRDDDGGDENP